MTTSRIRIGFTLLEVLLTLSLAVIIMGLVGGAMRTYVNEMNVHDQQLRQTQLAMQLFAMMETDLRSSLHPEPIDTKSLESFLQESAAGGDSSSEGGAAAEGGEEADLSAAGIEGPTPTEEETAIEPESASMVTAGVVLQSPGLIGTADVIQFDISRLPRLEEYSPILGDGTGRLMDVPSDMKTISYYVQASGTVGGVQDDFATMATNLGLMDSTLDGGGLVRRSLDRAITVGAAANGLAQLTLTGRIVAPEVTEIAFQYWDGLVWSAQWDSDVLGELPLAVEIQMTIQNRSDEDASTTSPDASTAISYRHVIRLPMARKIEETTEETTSETSTETDAAVSDPPTGEAG
jgi:type II secretory pathway pseudopilin PulG